MQPRILKGSNSSYIFFPNAAETIISRSKFSIVFIAAEVSTKQKLICKQLSPTLFNNQTARLKFFVEASFSIKDPAFARNVDLIVEGDEIF